MLMLKKKFKPLTVMQFRKKSIAIVNKMLGSSFTDTVFELSKYMSYVFLRNDMNLKTPEKDLMYSLGDVTKTIECDKRQSNIYAIIWNAYMYQNRYFYI